VLVLVLDPIPHRLCWRKNKIEDDHEDEDETEHEHEDESELKHESEGEQRWRGRASWDTRR
jgi:hypothetical protein